MGETGRDIRAWIDKTIRGWETQTRADIPRSMKEAYKEDVQFLLEIKEIVEEHFNTIIKIPRRRKKITITDERMPGDSI